MDAMTRPLVALLTDFGTRDFYVGAMKGAVVSVCPEAALVDLTHEIERHDVEEGAFVLAAACRAFPPGAVFVAVVDPGVGSARRALAIRAGGWRFVGPDNGLFTLVLDDHPEAQVRELTNAALFRSDVSSTFHGRDVFAPVAAHLAGGLPFEDVGPTLADPVRLDLGGARELVPGEWQATIVHRDRFGNLTTQLRESQLLGLLRLAGGDRASIVVRAGDHVLPLVGTYTEVAAGEGCALVGSAGRLEIAVNQGDAGARLGLRRGDLVALALRPA